MCNIIMKNWSCWSSIPNTHANIDKRDRLTTGPYWRMPGSGCQVGLVPCLCMCVCVCMSVIQMLSKSHKDVRQEACRYMVTRSISEQEDLVMWSERHKIPLWRVASVALYPKKNEERMKDWKRRSSFPERKVNKLSLRKSIIHSTLSALLSSFRKWQCLNCQSS